MMWYGHGFSWGWMFFGVFMMLLFGGGLIALVVLALRAFSRPQQQQSNPGAGGTTSALNILKERYARGEINKAEYEDIRHDLENTG